MRAGQNWPQAALMHQLHPTRRGWANDYRPWVSPATFGRLERLTWVKLCSGARRRHPNTSARWGADRDGHRRASRPVLAPAATRPSQAYLASQTATSSRRHVIVTGHRSPDDGDGVYGSQRRGQSPRGSPRLATLITHQGGRGPYGGRCFHHAAQLESDHSNGNRRDARSVNLQALHGHCHDAKSRKQGDYLPVGRRDNVSGH
jgi:RNA-directed DNA polymerase